MKQIKAFVHHSRVSAIVQALETGGFQRVTLFDVKGLLKALNAREQECSEFWDEQGDETRAASTSAKSTRWFLSNDQDCLRQYVAEP